MKNTHRLALLTLTLTCGIAHATGKTTPPPPPAPPPVSQPSANADANAQANASIGNVSATGGQGGSVGNTTSTSQGGTGQGGSAAGGSASSGNSSAISGDSYSAAQSGDITNQTKSQFVNFPQPVWTTVPTPYGCIVSKSRAGSFGWNFVSGSGSEQFSDAVCTAVRMAESATLHCHFATAAMLNKAAFEQMYKGQSGDFFLSGNPQNMDPVACEALRRPVLRMAPVMHTTPATVAASAAPQVNVMCAAPQTRATYRVAPKARPACVNCCK
jgi:hypothetical protein